MSSAVSISKRQRRKRSHEDYKGEDKLKPGDGLYLKVNEKTAPRIGFHLPRFFRMVGDDGTWVDWSDSTVPGQKRGRNNGKKQEESRLHRAIRITKRHPNPNAEWSELVLPANTDFVLFQALTN